MQKTEKMIIDNIDRKKDQNRISYSDARKIANKVINLLKNWWSWKNEYMGSLRRQKKPSGISIY